MVVSDLSARRPTDHRGRHVIGSAAASRASLGSRLGLGLLLSDYSGGLRSAAATAAEATPTVMIAPIGDGTLNVGLLCSKPVLVPSGLKNWSRIPKLGRASWTIRSARSRTAPSAHPPSSSVTRSFSAKDRLREVEETILATRCELRSGPPVLLSCDLQAPNDGEEGWLTE